MTLQASGSMTIADINTELGRASGAQLSTDDAELLDMAWLTPSDPITIPDDLYGTTHLGTLYGTYNVTIGGLLGSGNSFVGYQSGTYGGISSTSYRGETISLAVSYTSAFSPPFEPFAVYISGTGKSSTLITGVKLPFDESVYPVTRIQESGGNTIYVCGAATNPVDGPWDNSNLGDVRSVKIYGT